VRLLSSLSSSSSLSKLINCLLSCHASSIELFNTNSTVVSWKNCRVIFSPRWLRRPIFRPANGQFFITTRRGMTCRGLLSACHCALNSLNIVDLTGKSSRLWAMIPACVVAVAVLITCCWYLLACVPFGCCCCGLFYCIAHLRGLSCWRRDDDSTWPIFTWATGHGLPMITARHHIRARWYIISLPYAYPGDHQIMITL
jgi:hypothetical protein